MSTLAAEEQVITSLAGGAAAAAPSPTSGGDEEDSSLMKGRSPSARPACYKCCGCCAIVGAAAATVLLTVGFSLYIVREPRMTINAVSFRLSDVAAPPSLALRVVADVSVKNRNPVPFYFSSYQTAVYHRGALMARARGPGGRCGGRRTMRLNVTVDIPATARLLSGGDLVREMASGTVTMSTSTAIPGHVRVLGLFRHRLEVLMNCTAAVAIATQTITYQLCTASVKT